MFRKMTENPNYTYVNQQSNSHVEKLNVWDVGRLKNKISEDYGSVSACSLSDWPSLEDTTLKIQKLNLHQESIDGCNVNGSNERGNNDAESSKDEISSDESNSSTEYEGRAEVGQLDPESNDEQNSSMNKSSNAGSITNVSSSESQSFGMTWEKNPTHKMSKGSKQKWIPLILPDPPSSIRRRQGDKNGGISARLKSSKTSENIQLDKNKKQNDESNRHISSTINRKSSKKTENGARNGKGWMDRKDAISSLHLVPIYPPEICFSPIGFHPDCVVAYVNTCAPPWDDNTLLMMIRTQIEYYFGEENLCKDFFLRRRMDREGYIPIQMIASFQRIQQLTFNYDKVVEAIQASTKLEMKDGNVRTKINPEIWPIVESTSTYSPSIESSYLFPRAL